MIGLRGRRAVALIAVLVLVASVVLVAVTALGSDDSDGPDTPAGPTPGASARPTIDPAQLACSLLTSADRRRLAGSTVDDIVAAEGDGGRSQCRWQAESALVQVTTMPAEEWASTLPDVVKQLESSADASSKADRADLARAKKLLRGAESFSGREACAAFVTLSELGGSPRGTRTTVTALPITETEAGLSGQTCSDGTLTSVVYSVPGLTDTAASQRTLRTALAAAQRRAVAAA